MFVFNILNGCFHVCEPGFFSVLLSYVQLPFHREIWTSFGHPGIPWAGIKLWVSTCKNKSHICLKYVTNDIMVMFYSIELILKTNLFFPLPCQHTQEWGQSCVIFHVMSLIIVFGWRSWNISVGGCDMKMSWDSYIKEQHFKAKFKCKLMS